jgi:thiol:disulfide interchange protein DsbC
MMRDLLIMLGCLSLFSPARAADTEAEALLALLRATRPELRASSVSHTPAQGIFEVVMGRNLAYTDAQGRYLLFGNMLEMGTLRNLTAERKQALSRVDFKALPLAQSIHFVQGNGRRSLAVDRKSVV